MTDTILKVSGVGKRFGGFVALADVNLEIARGERLGLIGRLDLIELHALGAVKPPAPPKPPRPPSGRDPDSDPDG